MIVITGAAGFIGSVFLAFLNEQQIRDAVLIDSFQQPSKFHNLAWKYYQETVEREQMQAYFKQHADSIEAVIHLGGKSGYIHEGWEQIQIDAMELHQYLWKFCSTHQIPFIYASSGAVYSGGQDLLQGDSETSFTLNPAHAYAQTKLKIDQWSIQQEEAPPFWAGLRMSNVYGPNEYHKGANASLVYKAYNEILIEQKMKLFASDHADFSDGGMLRDYIYVLDVVKVIWFLLQNRPTSGIYNIASGQSISFKDATDAVFDTLKVECQYEYEPIPPALQGKLPYEVHFDISKLREVGYTQEFYSIQEGVRDYIERFLKRGEFY